MAKQTGKITQFGTKGYGFINGDDGHKYFAHQKNIDKSTSLKIGTKVFFTPQNNERGLIAVDIKPQNQSKKTKNMQKINILFTISFLIHIITIYEIFIK